MQNKISITFLVDNYYPKFSPVAKCAYNIAEELSSDYEVSVITLDGNTIEPVIEEHKNQRMIRCSTKGLIQRSYIEKKLRSNKVYMTNLFFIRMKGYLKAVLAKTNVNMRMVESYEYSLEKIKPDVIIPVCLPFETIIASMNYKINNSNVVLIPFLFDRFTYNKSLQRNRVNLMVKEKKHLELENQMLQISNHVLAMHQLKENFEKINYKGSDKITYIEHPLLKEPKDLLRTIHDEKIRLIYAGALYKNYRSPEYLLQAFNHIQEDDFVLKFFSAGNCEQMIEKYVEKDGRISRNGYVSVDVLEQEYSNANILLSIGNFKSQNLASKIFEYMSIGKPIIHFYENPKDPVLNLLNKYPLSLLIDQNNSDTASSAAKIREFCAVNKDSYVEFNKVKEIFLDATPAFITKKFVEIIKDNSRR